MKACVLEAVGKLTYQEVPVPEPAEDEVLLKVGACGICSSDIDRVFCTGTYHFPTIPGHEFAGVIEAVGAGVDPAYIGEHAAVFPLKPCFKCQACRQRAYARCGDYDYYGSRCDGAFAEYIAVKFWNLVFYEGIPDAHAALCEPAAVALHGAEQADIGGTDTVLVIGSGTIGVLTAMWAKLLGAGRVLIAGHRKERCEAVRALQVAPVLNCSDEDYEAQLSMAAGGGLADVVIECAGSESAIETALTSVKKGGRVVLMGNPGGDIRLDRQTYWRILRGELQLRGTWNSEYSTRNNNWQRVLMAMESGELDVAPLITGRYPLAECGKAFETLRKREPGQFKVLLETGAESNRSESNDGGA